MNESDSFGFHGSCLAWNALVRLGLNVIQRAYVQLVSSAIPPWAPGPVPAGLLLRPGGASGAGSYVGSCRQSRDQGLGKGFSTCILGFNGKPQLEYGRSHPLRGSQS
jgi:hypothetical protein